MQIPEAPKCINGASCWGANKKHIPTMVLTGNVAMLSSILRFECTACGAWVTLQRKDIGEGWREHYVWCLRNYSRVPPRRKPDEPAQKENLDMYIEGY